MRMNCDVQAPCPDLGYWSTCTLQGSLGGGEGGGGGGGGRGRIMDQEKAPGAGGGNTFTPKFKNDFSGEIIIIYRVYRSGIRLN